MNTDNTQLITNLLNDVDKMNTTGIEPNTNIISKTNHFFSNRHNIIIGSCSLISLGMLGYFFQSNWIEKLSTRINKFTIR